MLTVPRRDLATLALSAACLWLAAVAGEARCPGSTNLNGYGEVQLVPTGWENVSVTAGVVVPHMGGRTYFADACTAGSFDNRQYVALNLLGKTFRYTTDVSGAGCGCNAAFYLTSMRQNTEVGTCDDYYCDANNVCGVGCAEIDIQEANVHAWHSTLHGAKDCYGLGGGFGGGDGWDGPRDFTAEEYGPGGKCIDTSRPFDVAVSFPTNSTGQLTAMELELSQVGSACPLSITVRNYKGLAELTRALEAGMTPIASYWSNNRMLWLDGRGADHLGPCHVDHARACADTVKFYSFSIETLQHQEDQWMADGGVDFDLPPQPVQPTMPAWEPATTTAAATTAAPAWWTTTTRDTETAKALLASAIRFSQPAGVEEVDGGSDVCSAYLKGMGCGWTKSHSCPGQAPGTIGKAHDDGSVGFTCCCEFGLWKDAPDSSTDSVKICTASRGANVGDKACCGQQTFVSGEQDVCPPEAPTCIGYVQGSRWGTCHAAQPWQQCGGMKHGKPWWGPTGCTAGYTCKVWSHEYAQCARSTPKHMIMINKDEDSDLKMPSEVTWMGQRGQYMATGSAVVCAVAAAALWAGRHRRLRWGALASLGDDEDQDQAWLRAEQMTFNQLIMADTEV